MTTSDSENLKDNPDLGSIFEESCKAEKSKSKDFKPYDRNGKLKLKPVSDAEHKKNLKSLKSSDYVDFIDNENPNNKGRDD